MRVLRKDVSGAQVLDWQHFLAGRGLLMSVANGKFDQATILATKAFQKKHRLTQDGLVGNRTYAVAMQLGLSLVSDPDDRAKKGDNWPRKPSFQPLVGNAARQRVFGKFSFVKRPTRGNPEHIEITDDWARKNIVRVEVPQLLASKLKKNGRVQIHQSVANQFLGLWQAWDDAGLLDRVVSFNGSYVPRLVRRGTSLSNHAFGSAFDINVANNRIGHVPAFVSEAGCVRELVPIAHKFGFYWGGHFRRRDGMHFEVAVLKS